MPKQENQSGFGIVEVIVLVVVVLLIAGGGWYVWNANQKPSGTTTNNSSVNTATPPADLYTGWKSYCDTANRYCFKYPADWAFEDNVVLSPSKAVQIAYTNPNTRDGGPLAFMPSHLEKLSAANQDVAVVGGYYGGSSYSPIYAVVDESLLVTFSLTIGQEGQFPGNPTFANKATPSSRGQLTSTATALIGSVADAQSWLESADAKTSLKILQSFYYQQ